MRVDIQLKNNVIISYESLNPFCFLCRNFAPGSTFLIPLLGHFCLEGKSCLALCSSLLLCVCNQTKILPVLLTHSSTCSLPEGDVFTTLCPNPPHPSLCQGKAFPTASQLSVTSTSQSNCNTVCSDKYKLTPVGSFILKLTFISMWKQQDDIMWFFYTPFRLDFMRCTTLLVLFYH